MYDMLDNLENQLKFIESLKVRVNKSKFLFVFFYHPPSFGIFNSATFLGKWTNHWNSYLLTIFSQILERLIRELRKLRIYLLSSVYSNNLNALQNWIYTNTNNNNIIKSILWCESQRIVLRCVQCTAFKFIFIKSC